MSYCRWSSNDFLCDVYVYEHVHGGWTTHVATHKRVYKQPLPPPIDIDAPDRANRFVERWAAVDAIERELVPIGLPDDGKTFEDATPGKCADRLEGLMATGYMVPQSAIDTLREEDERMKP